MRARVKKGQLEALERLFESQKEGLTRVDGFHSVEFGREDKDPDRVVMIVHFRDRQSYVRNAERPETNRNYEEMVKHLEGPPEWIDVEYRRCHGQPVSEQMKAASKT
jgi:heme-degrading monooxygenase HmoA